MDQPYAQIEHRDQYLAFTGQPWPGRDGLEATTAAYPTVRVEGWAQEGWVFFLPGGQDGPPDQVGRVVVVAGGYTLPARVFRRELARSQWWTLSRTFSLDQELGFEEFTALLQGL